MNSYFTFFRSAPRLLTFGFALTLFSNFGQTFLIALFGDDIRAEFSLTHGRFGMLYSGATLL
ncbi:MAG: MFS transporter, partial [Gemmatimonadetes bacterium]|nr:MFS transporter [Gemmatimonadota bacterium]